jgi:hypothetical protein
MSYVPLIAYLIDLVATLLQQYGYLLQKKTHLKNENTRMSGYYLLDPQWVSGLALVFVAATVHAAVLPFADLVLLSTHCCWALVFCQVLSRIVLKEKLMVRYDMPAMVLLMSGCMIIVFNCNFEEVTYTADDI